MAGRLAGGGQCSEGGGASDAQYGRAAGEGEISHGKKLPLR